MCINGLMFDLTLNVTAGIGEHGKQRLRFYCSACRIESTSDAFQRQGQARPSIPSSLLQMKIRVVISVWFSKEAWTLMRN